LHHHFEGDVGFLNGSEYFCHTDFTSAHQLFHRTVGSLLQQRADSAVEKLMCGGEIGMAEVLTALQKADIAFKMMMQIRNKMVAAYQEIQNMRV
jgi:flagellar hook-basal body complex protein FliE